MLGELKLLYLKWKNYSPLMAKLRLYPILNQKTEDFFIDIIEFPIFLLPFFFVPHAKNHLYLIPH